MPLHHFALPQHLGDNGLSPLGILFLEHRVVRKDVLDVHPLFGGVGVALDAVIHLAIC